MFPKLAAFDLEIAKTIPENAPSWDPYFPLGITCAAVALEGEPEPIVWQGVPRMTQPEVSAMLDTLRELAGAGYTLLTWNGCKFDFHMLGLESKRLEDAAALAAEHVDLMLMFTFRQGHFLGLEKALQGAGFQGKRKTVQLKNGELMHDMNGAKAPHLWAAGEYDAVLSYLRDDVLQPIHLARQIETTHRICWTSRSGALQDVHFDRLYTVRESFRLPEPDTSWMRSPPSRADFISWMPGGVLPKPE
ncbi:MAG TPA: hypothetical protein VMN57_07050 [Anaerolineales bacterium]|nr:hypothetical protein [Anaerolineales bacterium]